MAPSDCTPPPTHTHRCGRQRCGPSLPDLRSLPGDRAPHPQRQCRWPQSAQSLRQTARASAWFVSGTVGGPKDSELVILVPPCPRMLHGIMKAPTKKGCREGLLRVRTSHPGLAEGRGSHGCRRGRFTGCCRGVGGRAWPRPSFPLGDPAPHLRELWGSTWSQTDMGTPDTQHLRSN